jgi:hypothetical protein
VPKKKNKVRKVRNRSLAASLDAIIRLLEELFILQAAGSRVSTGSIQKVLGIRKARISMIVKGVKAARKLDNKKIPQG